MTKGEIDRLGERLRLSSGKSTAEDIALLQEYRQSFQDAIARVFNTTLTAARKIDKQAIVTFRIKRIDTIIEKLIRKQKQKDGPMQLSRMWDIAGCRCIINTPDTQKLYDLLTVLKDTFGDNSKIVDHINPPKDDGYRSLHIYVKDKISGKRVEIQIRNVRQHNWATLVEIVDLLYGTHYKEHGNDRKLGRFLYLFSNAISLTDKEFSEMLKLERKQKVFERMSETLSTNYFVIHKQWLKVRSNGSYFVISANKKESMIESFPTFEKAEHYYYNKYLEGGDNNIVLTHILNPDFNQISIAYSNYILAMHAFFDDYRLLVSKKIIECVHTNSLRQFLKDFNIYGKNIKYYFKNLNVELNSIRKCVDDHDVSRNQINKWAREVQERTNMWSHETGSFLKILYNASFNKPLYRLLIRNRLNRLQKWVSVG